MGINQNLKAMSFSSYQEILNGKKKLGMRIISSRQKKPGIHISSYMVTTMTMWPKKIYIYNAKHKKRAKISKLYLAPQQDPYNSWDMKAHESNRILCSKTKLKLIHFLS